MSQFRLRRLQSDYDAVKRLVHLHPKIEVEGVSGNPPDRYRLVLRVRSLREQGERVDLAREHHLEITLPKSYPRDAPVCRMLTPVFHPNIAPHTVCVGDHWSAAESLDLMIQRIGEMLAFQSYNVQSPLNGQAARWVEEHLHRLPIDKEEFFIDLSSVERQDALDTRCSNCGSEQPPLEACGAGHVLCADCIAHCGACGSVRCLACGAPRCARCASGAQGEPAQPVQQVQPEAQTAPRAQPAQPAQAQQTQQTQQNQQAQPTQPVSHPGWVCSNCGNRDTKAVQCRQHHILCSACVARCGTCGRGLCVLVVRTHARHAPSAGSDSNRLVHDGASGQCGCPASEFPPK